MDIPVYLFTGFLEAGKTKFIRETLEDNNFNTGEPTLLILCEEGEEEIDLDSIPHTQSFTVVTFDEEQLLTPDRLSAALKRSKAVRVLVEYNGMWNIDTLYNNLPDKWYVCEEICLMDANTILAYNSNMRQLVFDKLKSPQMVIFNRCKEGMDLNELHKLARNVSRRTNIGYEYVDGTFQQDNIEDPLPFDLNAPVVEIADQDYAIWYSHMAENMDMYQGKTVSFVGVVARDASMSKDSFAIGRQVMTCCEADIAYRPIIANYSQASTYKNGEWVKVSGVLKIEKSRYYQTPGPVMYVSKIEKADQPNPPVATFY